MYKPGQILTLVSRNRTKYVVQVKKAYFDCNYRPCCFASSIFNCPEFCLKCPKYLADGHVYKLIKVIPAIN